MNAKQRLNKMSYMLNNALFWIKKGTKKQCVCRKEENLNQNRAEKG